MSKHYPKIPDYLKYMADDSLINTRDFADIMQYKSIDVLREAIKTGRVPRPDIKQSSAINTM